MGIKKNRNAKRLKNVSSILPGIFPQSQVFLRTGIDVLKLSVDLRMQKLIASK